MTGGAELVDLKIDKSDVDPEDVETPQDLVFGAFKDAHGMAGQLAQDKIGPLSQGMNDGGMTGMFGLAELVSPSTDRVRFTIVKRMRTIGVLPPTVHHGGA